MFEDGFMNELFIISEKRRYIEPSLALNPKETQYL
jgi:hypothetical protein